MTETNETNLGIDINFVGGPCKALIGHRIALTHASLTRISADGPHGQSMLLEALTALSRSVARMVDSIRWPAMENGLSPVLKVRRMSPCFVADQNRFYGSDSRNLSELFRLEHLISEYRQKRHRGALCQQCLSTMQHPSLADLAVHLVDGLEKEDLLMISASLESPGPKLRKKWMNLGFHRFWIQGQLVDSDDVDASSRWTDVQAVLIDALSLKEGADRVVEAMMTTRKMGSDRILMHHGNRRWFIHPDEPFCPKCLTTSRPVGSMETPSEPTVADLLAWLRSENREPAKKQTDKSIWTLSLLKRFRFDDLTVSTRMSDLSWADRGLLILLHSSLEGGPGRFILADAPFRGLDRERSSSLLEYIQESLGEGSAWIVADDDGFLEGRAHETLYLEGGKSERIAVEGGNRESSCPRLEAWKGRLTHGEGAGVEIRSGQWLKWSLTEQTGRKKASGWSYGPEPDPLPREPMLRVAMHEQAWKMSQGQRQTLAGIMGWDRLIADRMAQLPESRARGLDAARLLGRHPLGQCVGCRGTGMVTDKGGGRWSGCCPVCQGSGMRRYQGAPEYHRLTLYDIMMLSVRELDERFTFSTRLRCGTTAAIQLGFGWAELKRRIWTFSSSERWLLLLLSHFVHFAHSGLWIIEQPWLGLKEVQKQALEELFHQYLSSGGALVTIG